MVLSLALGVLPATIRSMPAHDFVGLSAMYELAPFGPEIENWRTAIVAATVATTSYSNANQKRPKQYKVADFLPNPADQKQTMEEQISLLRSAFPRA